MIGIVTDLHLGQKSFSKSVFDMQMTFFEKQFFPYLLKHNIKYVIHCGDLFHNRNIVDWYILNGVKKRFFKWFEDHGIEFHTIVGNHDSYYKSTIETNSLTETTKEFANVFVYDEPTTKQIEKYTIHFMPWIVNEKDVKLPEFADVIVGHFDVAGMQLMRGVYSSEGFEIDAFKKYKLVLSGHYHIKSNQKNFYMIGTQYQTNWGDFGIDKGFYTLEDNFKMKYHQNTVSPRFVKIFYTEQNGERRLKVIGESGEKFREITSEEAITVVKKNYCKLIVDTVIDHAAFESFFTSIQMRSRDGYKIELVDAKEVIESFDFEELEEKILQESDTLEVIHSFVAGMTFEEGITKDDVTEMFTELYREAEEYHNTIQNHKENEE